MDSQEILFSKVDEIFKKLDGISATQSEESKRTAVQEEKISQLVTGQNNLIKKHEDAFGDNGKIAEMKSFQDSCPRDTLQKQIRWLFTSLGGIAMVIIGKFFYK